MVSVGQKAPEFSLNDETGKTVSLSDFQGKKVVLYFYPKDNTPGCTTEACNFKDWYAQILAKNAVVIGISSDSERSHAKFKSNYDLPFYLLADPEKQVIKTYAWGEKMSFGKKYLGLIRSTFIIDEEGKIAKIFPKVSPKTHIHEVLEALETLSNTEV